MAILELEIKTSSTLDSQTYLKTNKIIPDIKLERDNGNKIITLDNYLIIDKNNTGRD